MFRYRLLERQALMLIGFRGSRQGRAGGDNERWPPKVEDRTVRRRTVRRRRRALVLLHARGQQEQVHRSQLHGRQAKSADVALRNFDPAYDRFGPKAERLRTSKCCPLRPRKRTHSGRLEASASCQWATSVLPRATKRCNNILKLSAGHTDAVLRGMPSAGAQ
jgi:hypothetical protein